MRGRDFSFHMASRHPDLDSSFMRRAMALAVKGRGAVEPNPMVGCVIVKDGRIVGEGYHEKIGGPHAEPNALAACTESPAGGTAYVTLEPCCHTNKNTPPCRRGSSKRSWPGRDRHARSQPARSCGRGVEQLRAAGIQVDVLDLASARQLIAPFIATRFHRRPYVTLKWAESSNGKIGLRNGRVLISSDTPCMPFISFGRM